MILDSWFLKKLPTIESVARADRLKIFVGPEELHSPVIFDDDERPLFLEPGEQPGVLTDGEHYLISDVDGRPKIISEERFKDCTGLVLFGKTKGAPGEPISLVSHQDSFAMLGHQAVSGPFLRDLENRLKKFVNETRPNSRQALIVGGMITDRSETNDKKIYVGAVSQLTKMVRRQVGIEPYVPIGPYRPAYDNVQESHHKDGTALLLDTRRQLCQIHRSPYVSPSNIGFSGSQVKRVAKRFGGPPERYPLPFFMTHSTQWHEEKDKKHNSAYWKWVEKRQKEFQEEEENVNKPVPTNEEMFELSWAEARKWATKNKLPTSEKYSESEYLAWLDFLSQRT